MLLIVPVIGEIEKNIPVMQIAKFARELVDYTSVGDLPVEGLITNIAGSVWVGIVMSL